MATQSIREILSRDFILGFSAQFAFLITLHILIPTLPIYLSRLGAREAEIGVLVGVFSVSSLAFRPFVGKALLRIPEKNFMIAGALLFVLTSGAYLLARPFWPLLVVRIVQGVGLAFFTTASFTLIANISPEAHRGQSLSYFWLAPNLSLVLAPALGMVLINRFSFTVLFLVCLAVSLASLLITYQLGKRPVAPIEDASMEGGFLLSRKALPPSMISFFIYFKWGALTTFFPLYAIDHGVANPGLFFTTIAIMLILGRTLGGRISDLYGRERVILTFLISYVLAMGLLAFSKNLPMFILAGVIWGGGNALCLPAVMAYALDRAGASRGPAMGTFTAISDLGMFSGPVIMGLIIPFTSYPIMFLCLAFSGILNLNYFYFFVRREGKVTPRV
ncbi:MAG: MFS transporter [Thermodesulfobacteriota bacterium]